MNAIEQMTGIAGIAVLIFVFVVIPLAAILMPFFVIAINGKMKEIIKLLRMINLKK